MRELLCLRHGTTEQNEKRLFTGTMDVPLSERGRAELAALSGTYPAATRFFTSGMRRAVETLHLLYGEVEHTDISDLEEYRFGRFQSRSHDDLYEHEPIYREWLNSQETVCPGGESRAMFGARVLSGWRLLVAQPWEGRAVLVSHGGTLVRLVRQIGLVEEVHPPHNGAGWMLQIDAESRVVHCEAFP